MRSDRKYATNAKRQKAYRVRKVVRGLRQAGIESLKPSIAAINASFSEDAEADEERRRLKEGESGKT